MDENEKLMRGKFPTDPRDGCVPANRPAREKAEDAPRVAFPKLDAQAIFAPLPEMPHQCKELDICSGAPILVAGYGFSGKTVAMQQLALDVVCGSPIWGKFTAKKGRVIHIDYEQGARLTRERYQRLSLGSLLGPSDLQDRLTLSCMPLVYLDSKYAEEHYLHELAGYDLCILDSLRAAAPSLDENSSEIRRVLDMLGRVSETTGCAISLIHHARKPSKDASGGAKMTIRGSGAIFDACSSVLVFDASKGHPTGVSHEKARNTGRLADDFQLTISDVEGGGLSVWAGAPSEDRPESGTEHDERVLEVVRENPGAGVRDLRGLARPLRNQIIDDAIGRLVAAGKVERQPGPRGAIRHFATEGAQ